MKRTGPKSKSTETPPKADLAERLDALVSEIRRTLGPKEGLRFANTTFAAALASAFGPGDEGEESAREAPPARTALRHRYDAILGESPGILSVLSMVDRVVGSDLPVLITGESGTGKELIARAIHENSPRAGRTYVRENCAAIPESLLESELFGYRRGAFTGAREDKRGLFEAADRGCVFLDEIGEMSLGMQSKLMRVLQSGEIRPVGADKPIIVDVRLISATNRDLRKMVSENRFREDLFFRLNVIPIHMPPLRDRTADVPMLAEAFLRAAAKKTGFPPKTLDPDALSALMRYGWPGNIRELENEIQRAFALSGPVIRAQDLSPEVSPPSRKSARSSNPRP